MGASKELYMQYNDPTIYPDTDHYSPSEASLEEILTQRRQDYINNANVLYCAEFMTETEYHRITNRIDKTFDKNGKQ